MPTGDGLIVFLGTQDLDATDRFYRQTLGLELYRDQGTCRIYNVCGGGKIGFCAHIPMVKGERSPIVTLVMDDVDGTYQHLIAAGVEVLHAPQENPRYHIYHFFTQDPNGYTLEVQRFLD
ncbi:MAG: VOC family protein [Bacillota bacterium]